MMHDRADTIDADLGIPGLATPNAPAQALDPLDDHRLRRHPRRVIRRQAVGDLLQVLQPHGDVEPVEHRRRGDAGAGPNTLEPGTTIGEGRQCRVLGSPDSVEIAADQRLNVGIGFGDGAENLAVTCIRFNIADPHLQMPLALRAAADERRIQGHHNRRRCCFRPDRSALTQSLADLQDMLAQGRMMRSCIDWEHLLQHIRGRPVGHQGAEMRLKPVQLRCRPASRWPANASLDPATCGTTKAGKP